MVGHLLVYHPGVEKLKEIADSGELGDIHYIYSQRLNLGQLRTDENALWSLGAHDVSVILHLANEDPLRVEARGEAYMREGVEDVVFAFLRFPSGVAAHLHLCWLDPHKTRRSPSSGPSAWRPSTTWSSSARSPSTTRASTRRPSPTASTSRARATSARRGSPTRSRCGSSASTSSTRFATGPSPAPTEKRGYAWSGCSPDLQEQP